MIVITERTRRLVQHNFVEYRGVRFAILFGTVRQQWRVAIYPVPNQLPEERTVFGTPRGSHNSSLNDRRSAEKAVFRWGPSVVADLLGRSPAPVLRHATHYAAAQRRKRGPRTPRKLKQQNSKTSDS